MQNIDANDVWTLVSYIQGWRNNGYTYDYRDECRRVAVGMAARIQSSLRETGVTMSTFAEWVEENVTFHHEIKEDWASMVIRGVWSGGLRFV